MSNSFASNIKKGMGRIVRKGRDYSMAKKRRVRLDDGDTVIICNSAWLARKASGKIKNFTRDEAFRIHSNIAREPLAAPVSQAKDYVIEQLLQKGSYTFSRMLIIKNPFGEAPLSALALFVTDKPCGVRVTVEGETRQTDIVAVMPQTTHHRVPLIGMYPGKVNRIRLELLEGETVVAKKQIPIKTVSLPPDLKEVIKVAKVSEEPAFENILVAGGVDIKTCVFDRDGKIRYYLKRKPKGYGIFPLSEGRFLFME